MSITGCVRKVKTNTSMQKKTSQTGGYWCTCRLVLSIVDDSYELKG